MATERSVLHVLPHPGGGGETYVDLLGEMPGYRFSRIYLAPSPRPSPAIAWGFVEAARKSRRHDLVHAHGEVAAALCLPFLRARPSVVTLHGLHLVRRLDGVRRSASVLSLRAVLRAADTTICVSEFEYSELTRLVGTAAARQALVIRNGVRIPPPRTDDARAAVRKELGVGENEIVAIWVGSLDERKDPLTAIRAANQTGVTLLVVGNGPLRSEVERASGEHVRVLGQRYDVPRLLVGADLYVLTSHREAGPSLSLLEAMAAGLAPIITDLPENVGAVDDTEMVVPCGDAAGLVFALARLQRNRSERIALGARARERVIRHFNADDMVRRTRELYEGVGRWASL